MIWNDIDLVLSAAVTMRTQKVCILANSSCKVDNCKQNKPPAKNPTLTVSDVLTKQLNY